ncbi:MAG TPA: hybrid sensor histidine kinase/response regulator [Candidatus Limnocylindrales bacterium]|nr:hybrid sensor histidine kinase/response regulator [Candidatus Limnocylindrales bacterium]
MNKTDEEFLKKLLSTFKVEAQEHLLKISSGLFELEKVPVGEKQMELLETIFREAHSLKGAARSVNLTEVERICQAMEHVFAGLKRKEITLSPTLFDVLHGVVDSLDKCLSSTEIERTAEEKSKISILLQQLKGISSNVFPPPPHEGLKEIESKNPLEGVQAIPSTGESQSGGEQSPLHLPGSQKPFVPEKPSGTDTVRISSIKLNSLLLQVEEMLSVKLMTNQRAADLKEIKAILNLWKQKWTKVQPEVRRVRQLLKRENKLRQGRVGYTDPIPGPRLLEFLDWSHATIGSLENRLAMLTRSAEYDSRFLGGMVDNLLEDMKKVLMLPFSSLLEIFPKLIRELSRDLGKDVELVIQGGEIEIDKRILEEMKDPFIHLIRNCIDHGIEDPKERIRKKKPPRGTITLSISQKNSNSVEVLISDDGTGIDLTKVKASALKLGLVSQEEVDRLGEQEILSFIFQSGVSTSPLITDISGRGLGLAIVREKVEKLGGLISVETYPQVGSTFRILLPLTLATFRGVLVQVDEHLFVIPSVNVERVVRIKKDEIKTVENKDTITLDGQVVPIVRLADVLELPEREKKVLAHGRVPLRPVQREGANAVDLTVGAQCLTPVLKGMPKISSASLLKLQEKGMESEGMEVRGLFPPSLPLGEAPKFISVLVLGTKEKRIAFSVDKVLNEQEVLVKSLGNQLSRVRNIAGATILGTGKVVPILNVSDLMKSAIKIASGPSRTTPVDKEVEAKRKSILVVEDSITTRTLLKNILESAGYHVKTVVDGVDALTALNNEDFDLVVSDVDMPRLNGFELTAKIRTDKRLSELPVVLVTSLASKEDQERGIDVGANAYIIKSGFEQSNLLEVIQRLI